MEHAHVWEKTGHYFATLPPKWWYICRACRMAGAAPDGEEVAAWGTIATDEEWDSLTKYAGGH